MKEEAMQRGRRRRSEHNDKDNTNHEARGVYEPIAFFLICLPCFSSHNGLNLGGKKHIISFAFNYYN